jgi:hypothetical protein
VCTRIKELIEPPYDSHPKSPFDHRKPPLPDWRQQLTDFESELLDGAYHETKTGEAS